MKAKALVLAVDRPEIAAGGYWLVTVLYVTAAGHKRKKQVFTRERPELHTWIVINTSRAVELEWGVA